MIANQPTSVRAALERDGLVTYFEVWGVSDDLGIRKPDPALFVHALQTADVAPDRSVMVGDRLDYDVMPAQTGRACGRCGCFGGRRPTSRRPTSSRSRTSPCEDLTELPAAVASLSRS